MNRENIMVIEALKDYLTDISNKKYKIKNVKIKLINIIKSVISKEL